MSTVDGDQPHVPDQLVDQLVRGYDALSIEIRSLDEQRRELENRLSWAKQQYLDALKRLTPQSASQDFHTFLSELDEAGICEPETPTHWLDIARGSTDTERQTRAYNIQKAADARAKISYRRSASDTSHGVRIWNGKSADTLDSGIEMERDFTTYGSNPGRLKCPFIAPKNRSALVNGTPSTGHRTPRESSISRGSLSGRRSSKRSSFHDPIRADICGNDTAVPPSPSAAGSAPLCPIRFLNQHSPEEVATYFEKHKHELPKSHEDCVMRYQTNEDSIKQLDAKYGSLVTMIQGLGQVHQPMFPEAPHDDEAVEDDDHDSQDRVKRWATNVNASLHESDDGADEAVDLEALPVADATTEDRLSHFDRSLKDIRVGESPSRPWGITVPDPDDDVNGFGAKSDHTASPRQTPDPTGHVQLEHAQERPRGKCPFDHTKLGTMLGRMPGHEAPQKPPEKLPSDPKEKPKPSRPSKPHESTHIPEPSPTLKNDHPQPTMVFNGPVFFGYSMDQAMALLQQKTFPGGPGVNGSL